MFKVMYARLQTEAYLPSIGALGTVFPTHGKTLDKLDMTAYQDFLSISFLYNGFKKQILVPYPNVVVMEVEPHADVHVAAKATDAAKPTLKTVK